MKTNIELAREAGIIPAGYEEIASEGGMPNLDRYTAAVEARLMERLLECAVEKPVARTMRYIGNDAYSKEHGNCARTYDELPDGTYKDTWEKINELYTRDQIAAAVLREREECAKVCMQLETAIDGGGNAYYRPADARQCVAAIRNRGTK